MWTLFAEASAASGEWVSDCLVGRLDGWEAHKLLGMSMLMLLMTEQSNNTTRIVMATASMPITLINIVQIITILYLAREHKFEADIEKIYIELFQPFKISR